MSVLVWGLEWRVALSRRRDLALWVLAPFAIVLVVGTDAVTSISTASWYAVLFPAVGVLRTALPLLRDGERGMTARVIRGGVSPGSYLVQRAAAGATLSLAQLAPSAILAAVLLHASFSEVLVVLAALAISLWIAALLGVLGASACRTRAETLPLCGVTLLVLLHMSGVFRVPPTGSLGAALEEASPFRALHGAFVRLVSGGTEHGVVAGLGWGIALPALVVAVAPRLIELLARDG